MLNSRKETKKVLNNPHRHSLVAGLKDLIDCGDQGTQEQTSVLKAIALGIFKIPLETYNNLQSVSQHQLAQTVNEPFLRRRYIQLAIMLELCRHPKSQQQLSKLESAAELLGLKGDALTVCRNMIDSSALEATTDYIRRYEQYFLALQEQHGPETFNHEGSRQYDDLFFQTLDSFSSMSPGSLGREFFNFYERNGMRLPSRTSINPGYYVCHDMNHVIAGYEPTGIGEICLGAFKLSMNDSDANWMASMTNFLIHEAGVFKPGHSAQYEPVGADGDPFDGLKGQRGVMTLKGAPEMLADALERGSQCPMDFSTIDHIEMATIPLKEIREKYNVVPPIMGLADASIRW